MLRSTRIALMIALWAAAVAAPGCGTRVFMTERDFRANPGAALDSVAAEEAELPPPRLPAGPVTTVLDSERKRRPISLPECIALALERGRLGQESIRVLALEPAFVGADIEQALSKFDAVLQSRMTWNKVENPTGGILFNADGVPVLDVDQRHLAAFNSGLFKPLASGGLAGVSFDTNYSFDRDSLGINPVYAPKLQFSFEQPLLRGFGVAINQLRSDHPGSVQHAVALPGGRGILLARLAFDQSRAEFERRVQDLVLEVERAYWNLYGSYWTLYSREAALTLVLKEWQTAKERFENNQLTIQDLAQIEEQVHFFRGERLSALGNGVGRPGVLESERILRVAIGLPVEDGEQLIPSDEPTVAPYRPDWQAAVQDAVALRPELVRTRQELESAYLALVRDQNLLLPDLRFVSSYGVNGVGSRLDGPGADNALRSLSANQFNDWTLGFRVDVPIGFRDANAQVRKSRLFLSQRVAELRNQEELVVFELQQAYREVIESQEQAQVQSARRQAAAQEVKARLVGFRAGVGDINLLLQAQRSLANALLEEQTTIVRYNIALSQFERSRGTILAYDNVVIAEGPLPPWVQERASDHWRERQRALVLRRRDVPPLRFSQMEAVRMPREWNDDEVLPAGDVLRPPSFFEAAPVVPPPVVPPEAEGPPPNKVPDEPSFPDAVSAPERSDSPTR